MLMAGSPSKQIRGSGGETSALQPGILALTADFNYRLSALICAALATLIHAWRRPHKRRTGDSLRLCSQASEDRGFNRRPTFFDIPAGPKSGGASRALSPAGYWPAWVGISVFLILASPAGLTAAAEPAPAIETGGDLQGAIDVLEDEQKRKDVLKLLKLMAAAQDQDGAGTAEEGDEPARPDDSAAGPEAGLKNYLSGRLTAFWRDLSALPSGLRQAGRSFDEVASALAEPAAVEIWRPYALKISVWGLICLLATWLIVRKYGPAPPECYSRQLEVGGPALLKYIFILVCPNLVLIFSLLAIPPLPTTLPGVTADMATGFSLIHSLIQHFFITLSVLYISLKIASVALSPNCGGHLLFDVHPVTARHLLRSWRVFSIYVAIYIFIDESVLNHFAGGLLYSLCLVLMTLPIPVYLSVRLRQLRRLVHAVDEAEASAGFMAGGQEFEGTGRAGGDLPKAKLDYRVDLFVRRHWSPLLIASVWLITVISLFNPLGLAGQFGARIAATIIIAALALVAVNISRRLFLKLVSPESEGGRRVLLKTDGLVNLLVWLTAFISVTVIWGLPLGSFFENVLVRDIAARAFAITVTVLGLIVFIRFSHVATDWLLSVPSLEGNRNWRTITPLVLTSLRALAVFVAVVVILERLGVNIGPILAGAGILGLGVGMGAQSLVKDVINGVSILLMDTLAVGDWVTVGGQSGTVMSVGIRSIRLRDSAGNLIVVPNSSVDSIINMTKDYSQDLVEFTVPYDADPDEMLKMAAEVAGDLSSDSAWKRYLTAPISVVGVTAFDANGTTIRLKINTTAGDQWSVGRELRLRLKRRMMKEGLSSNWFGQNLFLHQAYWGEAERSGPNRANEEQEGKE